MLLSNDIEKIKNRTKLTLADTHKLTELSVNIGFSLHENRIRSLENVILFEITKKSPNTSNDRAEAIIFILYWKPMDDMKIMFTHVFNQKSKASNFLSIHLPVHSQRQWRHSGAFIFNFEHIFRYFSSISIADFEQVNVCWISFTLNKQDPAMQYTIENEGRYKSISTLGIKITSIINDIYEFNIHHEEAITNIHCIKYRNFT